MQKPEYIKNLEISNGIFSEMICHELKGDFLKFLNERKLSKVYEKSFITESGYLKYEEVIFKSQQNFYLHVKFRLIPQSDTISNLTIYYNIQQDTELFMFLSQLLKLYKNATNIDRRT
jgi:hypothetical protein